MSSLQASRRELIADLDATAATMKRLAQAAERQAREARSKAAGCLELANSLRLKERAG